MLIKSASFIFINSFIFSNLIFCKSFLNFQIYICLSIKPCSFIQELMILFLKYQKIEFPICLLNQISYHIIYSCTEFLFLNAFFFRNLLFFHLRKLISALNGKNFLRPPSSAAIFIYLQTLSPSPFGFFILLF